MLGPSLHMKKNESTPSSLSISSNLSLLNAYKWAFVPVGFCPVGFCPSGLLSYTLYIYLFHIKII